MIACLFVGMGGFAGAVLRYLISLLPYTGDFPLLTLVTNFLGALFIGVLTGIAEEFLPLPRNMELFLKTGVCGGFTTFSTFSLETLRLLEKGKYLPGVAYAVLSVLLCLLGVFLGKVLVKTVK